ncbi:MAG: 16S rRNA (guanine(527)-N(7))-methyltransferase RsmG [candidate division WOR-3 bacterium]
MLKKGLKEMNIDYSESAINKFSDYLKILYSFEGRLHLISRNDFKRISLKHFLPSLIVLRFLGSEKYACDIGAGAGFPSIPVKILKSEVDFTLFESVKKRAHFLRDLIKQLSLSGIEVIDERAEHYNYKGRKFDLILVRAAGRISYLVKTIDQLIAPEGRAIFYKTMAVADELKQAEKKLHQRNFSMKIEKVFTPLEHIPMTLVVLKKKNDFSSNC